MPTYRINYSVIFHSVYRLLYKYIEFPACNSFFNIFITDKMTAPELDKMAEKEEQVNLDRMRVIFVQML